MHKAFGQKGILVAKKLKIIYKKNAVVLLVCYSVGISYLYF